MTSFPPSPPTNVRINNVPESDGMDTHAHGSVTVKADLYDSNQGHHVRMRVVWSVNKTLDGTHFERFSGWRKTDISGTTHEVTLTGLHDSKRYYVELWAQDQETGKWSSSQNTANFWTFGPHDTTGGGGGGGGGGDTDHESEPIHTRPGTPGSLEIEGHPETDQYPTKQKHQVDISGIVRDADGDRVRLYIRWSPRKDMKHSDGIFTPYAGNGHRVGGTLHGLEQDTLYYVRVYAQDIHGKWALVQGGPDEGERAYNSATFWTNRAPSVKVRQPAENATFPVDLDALFAWKFTDLDPNDTQSGYQLRYRRAANATRLPGNWQLIDRPNQSAQKRLMKGNTFKGNTFYEWQVRVKDQQDLWGNWSLVQSFFTSAVSTPPKLIEPIKGSARDVHDVIRFRWKFRDPQPGAGQDRADFRYRVSGADESSWNTVLGTENTDQFWDFDPETFAVGYHYEWQLRTYKSASVPASEWSDSARFWGVGTPGEAGGNLIPELDPLVQGSLGCGTYQVFVYERGGQRRLGELDPIETLQFNRIRDDISHLLITSNGFTDDCGDFYRTLRSWMHELVVFRDGKRVWEGPITRITYNVDSIELEAQDVMAYVYRRIMRQGFNDAYRVIDHEQVGLLTVVERSQQIIMDALAPSDPNVLPYLTSYMFEDDARQSHIVPDYARTAWEQVDDFAATAGLDYVVIGRRIVLNDVHRPIGRLPEMRDGDFLASLIVTEYGMQLTNYSAVTNGSGIWGAAEPRDELFPFESYGPVEMLASAYGSSTTGEDEQLTANAINKLERTYEKQAKRNIAGRWPTPVVVRVPDNSTVSPEAGVSFDMLIPGVWIPLRSTGTIRDISQWQKLDSVTVTYQEGQEVVAVVLSPAPNRGQDPDAGGDTEGLGKTDTVLIEDEPLPEEPAEPDPGVYVPGPGDQSLPMLIGKAGGHFARWQYQVSNEDGDKDGAVNSGFSARWSYQQDRFLPTTFEESAADGDVGRGLGGSFYSWNPGKNWMNSFITDAAKQAEVLAFLDTWPTGHLVWLTFGDNPENQDYDATDFRLFTAKMHEVVQLSVNVATMKYGVVLDGQTYVDGLAAQWYPADPDDYDFVGIRYYDLWRPNSAPPDPVLGTRGTRHTPDYWVTPTETFAASKPIVVSEFSLHSNPEVDIDRPNRLSDTVTAWEDAGAEAFFMWTDREDNDRHGPWQLNTFENYIDPYDRTDVDEQTVTRIRDILGDHVRYGG